MRISCTNNAPITINLYHNLDFVFDNPFAFAERAGDARHFEGEGDHSTWIAANTIKRNLWETNFVHDVSSFKLYEFEERGKGSSNVSFILAEGTMHSHVSQIPKGRYKKAHRHAAGTHVHAVDGTGYSLLWSGQFEYLQRAMERLNLVLPLTLAILRRPDSWQASRSDMKPPERESNR